jgi:hypothetical protein
MPMPKLLSDQLILTTVLDSRHYGHPTFTELEIEAQGEVEWTSHLANQQGGEEGGGEGRDIYWTSVPFSPPPHLMSPCWSKAPP